MTESVRYHRLYGVWRGMIRRCTVPKDLTYKNYGARGITVCKEWQVFSGFVLDMNESFMPGLTLDRLDNNKGYFKDNCRWATDSEQNHNKRLDKRNKAGKSGVFYHNKRKSWCARLHIDKKRITIGHYQDINLAIEARRQAEINYLGRQSPS